MIKLSFKKASLLTNDQFYDNKDIIKDIGEEWWLRSKTETYGDKRIVIREPMMLWGAEMPKNIIDITIPSNVDYFQVNANNSGLFYGGASVTKQLGIRPVLYLSNRTRLKPGTNLLIYDKPYTVLNDGLVFADFIISTSAFNNKEGQNSYKNSLVKKQIVSWFKEYFLDDVDVYIVGED